MDTYKRTYQECSRIFEEDVGILLHRSHFTCLHDSLDLFFFVRVSWLYRWQFIFWLHDTGRFCLNAQSMTCWIMIISIQIHIMWLCKDWALFRDTLGINLSSINRCWCQFKLDHCMLLILNESNTLKMNHTAPVINPSCDWRSDISLLLIWGTVGNKHRSSLFGTKRVAILNALIQRHARFLIHQEISMKRNIEQADWAVGNQVVGRILILHDG